MTKSQDGKLIMVVNDTEEIIELFREIIQGLGHRMVATTFAPEDLVEIVKTEPDLIILDLMFGAEPLGWQLLQKLKMQPETAPIPAIVCTAASDQVREQEGWLVSKNVKLVLKPFELDDLELAIDKALRLPEMAV